MEVCLTIFIGLGGGLKAKARDKKGENAVGNPDCTHLTSVCLECLTGFYIFSKSGVKTSLGFSACN